MTIDPKIITMPIMNPNANAYDGPTLGSHQKIDDQFVGGP